MRNFKKALSLVAALAVMLAVIPFSGLTAFAATDNGDISVITCDEEKLITVDESNNGNVMYLFTPERDGTYAFYSYDNHFLVTGSLIDITSNQFVSNEDGGRYGNFYIQYEMKAGNTYILQAKPKWRNDCGFYSVKVKELTAATGFSVECSDKITDYVGTQTELHAEFAPDNAIIETITWKSDDEEVVTAEGFDDKTLNCYGLVRFVSPGTATVTATTESGMSVSISITVSESETIACDEEKYLTTDSGSAGALYSFVPNEDGTYLFYSYNNDNFPVRGTIFDADMNWLIEDSRDKEGNFNVQYNMNAKETYYLKAEPCQSDSTGSYCVKVVKTVPADSITLTLDDYVNLYPGFGCDVYAEFAPINAAMEDITWTSSNPEVVNINSYNSDRCYVEFLSAGTAVITAETQRGLSDSIAFTVNDTPEITENTENTVEITEPYQEKRFKFTPSETGYYSFEINSRDRVNFDIRDNNNEFLVSEGRTFNYYLNAGETYYLDARLHGDETGTYTFTVSKMPEITELEITAYPNRMDYFDNESDFYYYGLKLRAQLDNGTTCDWEYYDNTLAGYDVYIEDNFIDGKYVNTTVSCGDKIVSFEFNILENPVESIEILSDGITLIENAYGHFEFRYDSESDSEVEYFYYNYSLPSDLEIKINYKNKPSVTANINDLVDGYCFNYYSYQRENPWTLGGDNYITISYIGISALLPVNIIENPVDHIEINTAPTREYIYGDNKFGFLDYDGTYYFEPYDMTGLSFTVYYTDNTSKTFTYNDIDYGERIDGYDYLLSYYGLNPPLGNFTVTFSYMGKSADYTVLLKESIVKSISVTKKPYRTAYTDYYMPDFLGTEFTITYTDDTSEVVTLTEENLLCKYGNICIELPNKENAEYSTLTISPFYHEEGIYFMASYFGKSCDIRDITFTEEKEIDSVEFCNVSSNGDGMTVIINYTDKTTQTLIMEALCCNSYNTFTDVFALTENGILQYQIETHLDSNGKLTGYTIDLFGKSTYADAQTSRFGDVNGDTSVDMRDLIALKNALLDDAEYIYTNDVNLDGSVDADDLTALRKALFASF